MREAPSLAIEPDQRGWTECANYKNRSAVAQQRDHGKRNRELGKPSMLHKQSSYFVKRERKPHRPFCFGHDFRNIKYEGRCLTCNAPNDQPNSVARNGACQLNNICHEGIEDNCDRDTTKRSLTHQPALKHYSEAQQYQPAPAQKRGRGVNSQETKKPDRNADQESDNDRTGDNHSDNRI